MECNGTDSRSIQGLQSGSDKEIGLVFDAERAVKKPRVEKMEEEKIGKKKRSAQVTTGFDSDDDEPIGSLFKVKSRRNPKKVKANADGCEDKGNQGEVVGCKDVVSMDDTLANFRKKLKGPKKDSRVGAISGKDLSIDLKDPVGQSSNGDVKDGDAEEQLLLKMVERGKITSKDGTSVSGKSKTSKSRSASRKALSSIEFDNVIDDLRSGEISRQNDREHILELEGGTGPCLNDNLEDSLSAFFLKAQSGSLWKSHRSLKPKQVRVSQACNDGVAVSSSHPISCEDSSISNCCQDEIEKHQKPKASSSPVSKFMQASPLSGDLMQEPSIIPILTDEKLRLGGSILEGKVPVSYLARSESYSKCPDRTQGLEVVNVNRESNETYEKLTENAIGCMSSENGNQFHCAQAQEECKLPNQDPTSEIHNFEDVSPHPSPGIAELDHDGPESKIMEGQKQQACPFRESMTTARGYIGDPDTPSKVVLPSSISTTDQKIPAVLGEHDVGLFDGNHLNKAGEAIYSQTINHLSAETLEPSASLSQDSLAHKKNLNEGLKSVGGIPLDGCHNGSHDTQPHSSSSAFLSPQKEVTSSDGDSLNRIRGTSAEDPDIASISSQKEDASVSDSRLSPVSSGRATKYNLAFRVDHLGKSSEVAGEEAPATAPNQNEAYGSETGSMPDPERKDKKHLAGKRLGRQTKRYRHGDMAYEGDADWEILVHEQNFLVTHHDGDRGQSFKTKEKLDFLSTMALEAETGGAAAVSVGLKARKAGPVEKIKFKELLKRKGGLQEYIECRNHILHLWNKDVTRILPLSECGVSVIAVPNEHPQASLVRDIYAFLDQYGYINFGVASEKEMADAVAKHSLRLSEEKNTDRKSGAPVTDSDDGVSFILGQVKTYDISTEEKDEALLHDDYKVAKADANRIVKENQAQISCTRMESKLHSDGESLGYNCHGGNLPNNIMNPNILSSTPCTEVEGDQSDAIDQKEASQCLQCDSEIKKEIIIIGAGPAGLTAARHLQRQGFHVTVLEARSRIGGRVFTDCSSLSVPVDLGASIITGVEADVATERRPDPSSLICAQLGLELTVLKSDCPLYDTVTGRKVPADLDESLEAEYNSLIDDMQLVIAQNGDHAMTMSLEDGLEYALKMRRTARYGGTCLEPVLHKSDHVVMGSDKPSSEGEILSALERRVMDWHFAHLEYGCAASLKEVSLPYWNQDDEYGGFGGAHCMIKGGYSTIVDSLRQGLCIHLNHVVTDVCYHSENQVRDDIQYNKVQVSTSNGKDFTGDAVLITVPLGCLKAETIKFSPQLPQWKCSSIQRLGFGVLNKVVLEFSEVFWDDSVDYFGATAEETDLRGWCFMFWNVKKTVGAPVLIALVVGKAAINGHDLSSSDHVKHALFVLRKLFGEGAVPDPVASVVTDWGRDQFSFGAYSYVAIGASGEDYDILGRPVDNCLFFAGEATCKEHPDTVGGAMMSGLREAVRITDILNTGNDCTAEVEAMEAARRHADSKGGEVRDIIRRLDAIELTNVLYKNSLDGSQIMTREGLLQDLFSKAKSTAGRLYLVKELLNLPTEVLKSFAGTKEGLSILNSWILDSMGKDGTQLLRHCVRLLVLVSTDLLAVRLSGIGKTVKEKVCVHTSRDIRAIASQLVSVWVEIFRKEKASNGGLKLLRQSSVADTSKSKSHLALGKPPLRAHHAASDNRGVKSAGNHSPAIANNRKANATAVVKSENKSSRSQGSGGGQDCKEDDTNFPMSEEEKAAFAAAEAARAAAQAAAEAYASSGAKCNTPLQLPKIPSFHKFARREQYAQMDDCEFRRKWSGGIVGRQDCTSEIDSRNCRVRDWSIDFSAAGVNLDSSKMSVDNHSQRSHSNENVCQLSYREHSGESAGVDSNIFTKAWVDSAGSEGIKDYNAIERWQTQAAAADSNFFRRAMHVMDEEDSNMHLKPSLRKHDGLANESSASQVTVNRELVNNQPRGVENIKQAVVDYVASLLMPLYKARKIDKEGYKSIMKKTATKVMDSTTDAEKAMAVFEFLDFKRKNKIRAFVDKLIERHMATKPEVKS